MGCREGIDEGRLLGGIEGCDEGLIVGCADGVFVGDNVGVPDGAVGRGVGLEDGGAVVGTAEG